jgi:glutamate dehydrogenase/leucine dehydrogenase
VSAGETVRDLLDGVLPGDGLGPEATVVLRDAETGVTAAVVIDNTACGPAIGGVRMAPDVTLEEVARLARAMTRKNAAAGLPHGGAKAGIAADPFMPAEQKERVVRWFARSIADLRGYIPGPDMGTDERCMAWVREEIGRSVGLPASLGGIPLDEIGATAFGLAVAADAAQAAGVIALDGARVAIQGFGAVGANAARFLAERGATIVAVSDSEGARVHPVGLDVDALLAWKRTGRSIAEADVGEPMARDELIGIDCEILIPAARPDVITVANVHDIKARLVLEGANIPATVEAEVALHERGVLCLPDFIVNAGGVICGSVEYHGGTRGQALDLITDRIGQNVAVVIERSLAQAIPPREAAEELAMGRLRDAMGLRRSYAR